ETPAAVLRVAPDEFKPRLVGWQGRGGDIDAQHAAKPSVLPHALMHHVLAHAAPARVLWRWSPPKIVVPKLAPHAQHLDSFGRVAVDEKLIAHVSFRHILFSCA